MSKYFSYFMWMESENQVSRVPQRRVVSHYLPMWHPIFQVSSQSDAVLQACFQLVPEIYCLILLYLLGSDLWPGFQSPKMPRATKNSAHMMDTSVNQETSMISQYSSSSDQEMEVQIPVFLTIQHTGHSATVDNFNIIRMEDRDLARTIKEAIYIRVNNPSLHRNVGKYHLNHLWDRVLFNTPGLKIDSTQHPLHIHNNGFTQTIPTNNHSPIATSNSGHALNSEHVLRDA